ncbi:MAG: hypothetical protein EOP00_08950 [Pedobacter sp.]|nr:MAG: hypothetical protein EOP00_08950 [Pedobacter sp.]
MKKLLLCFLLCSFAMVVSAQSSKSSLFLNLGPSIPTGDFSSTNSADEKAGLATTGFYFDLGYEYQFAKNVGAFAMFNLRTNGIAKDALNYSLPTGSGGSMSITATSWNMSTILGGLSQSFPIVKDEKFSIGFREAVGVQFTSSPELNINYNIPGIGASNNKQESSDATSFSYLLGLNLKYQINKRFGLKLNADYQSSNPKFTVITYPADAPVENETAQKISSLNLGLGLTIRL